MVRKAPQETSKSGDQIEVKTLPNFFIVGAARSGTTSLDRYLSQHPEIYVTPRKETHFFAVDDFPPSFKGPGDEKLNTSVIRDEEQYAQLFASVTGKKAIGESSAFYLYFLGTAERITQAVPDAKIIILLREPVARAFSAYSYMVSNGRETLSFEEGLNQEEERRQEGWEPIWWYKELGLYYRQVRHYLEVFGTQQVKVLLYDELCANAGQMLRDVFAFLVQNQQTYSGMNEHAKASYRMTFPKMFPDYALGVEEDVGIDTSVRHNPSGAPKSRRLYTLLGNFIDNPNFLEKRIKSLLPSRLREAWASKAIDKLTRPALLDPQIHAQLQAYFAEDVSKLEDLLHRDLLSWQSQRPNIAHKP